jgi:CheY-like chemotaxis protein
MLFYHPCTWVVVDDEARFLSSIEMVLPPSQPYKIFDDPFLARDFLATERLRNSVGKESNIIEGNSVFVSKMDLGQLTLGLSNLDRFGEVSVVVSDFAMIGMNGLQLFESIGRSSISRILLTGVATEKTAVQAFNSGLIDRYIQKNDLDAVSRLLTYCEELQQEQFCSKQSREMESLTANYDIFDAVEFVSKFEEFVRSNEIVEYYFSDSPLGYLGIDARGAPVFLHLVSKKMLEEQVIHTKGFSAPIALQDRVARKEISTMIFEVPNEVGEYDWSFNSIKISPIGATGWFSGMHDSPPLEIDYDPIKHSVRAVTYLEN